MELISLGNYQSLHKKWTSAKASLGFVPTMGALHVGHLKLIDQAISENDYVVLSIFVNPSQFNNAKDFQLYPRTIERDVELLKEYANLYVICPTVEEIYPRTDSYLPMPLGSLGKIMEGEHRPGHFEGVVHVVHNLFKIVRPNRAYFGLKDFQQFYIIRKLVDYYNFKIEIIPCETIRSHEGLALSSRNERLDATGLKKALGIFQALEFMRLEKNKKNIDELIVEARQILLQKGLQIEYLELRDYKTLGLTKNLKESCVCFIAVYCQGIRLIDNMLI